MVRTAITAPIEPQSSPFLPTAAPLFPPVPGLELELELGPELELEVPLGVAVGEPVSTGVDDDTEIGRVLLLLLLVLSFSELLVLGIGVDLEEVIRDEEGPGSPPAHSATCSAKAAARSERSQFAWIQAATAFWNRLFVQTQDISV